MFAVQTTRICPKAGIARAVKRHGFFRKAKPDWAEFPDTVREVGGRWRKRKLSVIG